MSEEQVVPAPAPLKAPVRMEIALFPDESGMRLGDVVSVFVYRYPQDPYAGGADRAAIELSSEQRALLETLFNSAIDAACVKHNTCSVGDALRLPQPKPPQGVAQQSR